MFSSRHIYIIQQSLPNNESLAPQLSDPCYGKMIRINLGSILHTMIYLKQTNMLILQQALAGGAAYFPQPLIAWAKPKNNHRFGRGCTLVLIL